MNDINLYAVLVATIASFIFGALWYSPVLFLKRWCKETGVDLQKGISNPAKTYGLTFLLTLISVLVFALILGNNPDLKNAISTGVLIGAGIVLASMGINYQFAQSSLVHWLIDGCFHIGRFMIAGLVLGFWP